MIDEMRRPGVQEAGLGVSAESVAVLGRAAATCVGIIAIVVGLVCAVKVFNEVYASMLAPESLQPTFVKWTEVVGGDSLKVEVDGVTYNAARPTAILVFVVEQLVLAWIAMGIMFVGARVVSQVGAAGKRPGPEYYRQRTFPPPVPDGATTSRSDPT
jgi:hypothetical protein